VLVLVVEFQICGLSPLANEPHHNTFPFGSRTAWVGFKGQLINWENCPTTAGFCALAQGDAKASAVSSRTLQSKLGLADFTASPTHGLDGLLVSDKISR
jgi:hypothetical protein